MNNVRPITSGVRGNELVAPVALGCARMTEPAHDDVLDVPAVMAMLKLGRSAVYDACGRPEIPHRRVGKLLRFSRRAILDWLADPAFGTVMTCDDRPRVVVRRARRRDSNVSEARS